MYFEQSTRETTVHFQSDLFNDSVYQIVRVFMGKYNMWKHSGEWEEKEGEREREQPVNGVREGVLVRNWNGMG